MALSSLSIAMKEVKYTFEDAVIEQLIVHHIYTAEHDTNPLKAIRDLMAINVAIALDPKVSSDAAALYERGFQDGWNALTEFIRKGNQ